MSETTGSINCPECSMEFDTRDELERHSRQAHAIGAVQDAAAALEQDYQAFMQRTASLFPKVDQKLLFDILQYESTYSDWEGNVVLKVVYPAGTDMKRKKELIYSKFQRIPSIEEDRTARFKAIRTYLKDIAMLVREDPEIEFITGSATLSPSEAYAT